MGHCFAGAPTSGHRAGAEWLHAHRGQAETAPAFRANKVNAPAATVVTVIGPWKPRRLMDRLVGSYIGSPWWGSVVPSDKDMIILLRNAGANRASELSRVEQPWHAYG